MANFEKTHDDFLGGRIKLYQPKKGYRVTSDSVFLAASVTVKSGEKILDIGAGTGAILSCLSARLENRADITMHGLEYQEDLIELARKNAENVEYFQGDVFGDDVLEPNSYHHVVSNPPYYDKGTVTESPYVTKAMAHGGGMDSLKLWIERCVRMVRPRGYITLVHRADKMDDIIEILNQKCGGMIIYPFYSKSGQDANRVIIRAQKDAKGLLSLKSGMIVHKSNGDYTNEAENILRHAHFLDIEK
ncbi:tRNA1(Val) (adenine(37)-N6)-methyltransferase [Pseudemcibacter aquimaris]|uniref:tRNA1(Val) (adenine(37)-N6)-methyltransferase n=1 Tax=Pseudemcibacter aquimaris TaxID=2857064 RepID=UPI002011A06C|nr:methyltransferase [Pseudemcibacter aquimaris]MCC3862443.1 methyltransferase [Pseudemcibacter aquimaris]WDU59128.1 methyltransferase domain-containing protein [Pseudemcibacter aquimaris]